MMQRVWGAWDHVTYKTQGSAEAPLVIVAQLGRQKRHNGALDPLRNSAYF